MASSATAEFYERKSRFISYASPAASEKDALAVVNSRQSVHPTASHCCWAYVVGLSGQFQRASDDGEPSGTAGRPILDVLCRQELVNVIVVVTRYFGGILLGAGGLVRAYTEAAKRVIDAACVAQMVLCNRVAFSVDYNRYRRVQRELEMRNIPIDSLCFESDVSVEVRVKSTEVDELKELLLEISCGECEVRVVGDEYCALNDDGHLSAKP